MKTAYITGILATLVLLFNACERVKDTAKNTVNKAGDVAGQTAGELLQGAAGGIDKAFELKVELSANLQAAGLKLGKCKVGTDTLQNGAVDNVAIVYIIFDKDVAKNVTAKAFDVKGQEMGRSLIKITGKAGNAGYLHIPFNKETNLDSDSRVTIE